MTPEPTGCEFAARTHLARIRELAQGLPHERGLSLYLLSISMRRLPRFRKVPDTGC